MKFKTQWDLKQLGDWTPDKIEKEQKKITEDYKQFVKKWTPVKEKIKGSNHLKSALDELKNLSSKGDIPLLYLWLSRKKNLLDKEILALYNKSEKESLERGIIYNKFDIELKELLKENNKIIENPILGDYKHLLECMLEAAKTTLSEKEEKILAYTYKTSKQAWVDLVERTLSKEEVEIKTKKGSEKKNFSELSSLVSDRDKNLRGQAAKALNEIFNKHLDVAEAELNAVLENRRIRDELRGYPRPDSDRHIGDDVTSKAIDCLRNSVSKGFKLSNRFYELKSKLLKQKLSYAERNVAYGDVEVKYPFEEASNLVIKTLSGIDKEFGQFAQSMFENGRVDVFPSKGKDSGAFCLWWSYETPIFILLNHTDKIRDVKTIAHELGHAINTYYSKKKNNALNFDNPTSTTEVASTFMEDFVFQELVKKVNDEDKLALYMEKLNDEVTTIFRQIACYNFEWDLHKIFREKSYLTEKEIGEIFAKNMKDYMGESIRFNDDEKNWWVYWSHIRNYFYVYSYASGLLISKALQRKLREDPKFISKIKNFLSAGSSKSPRDIFLECGIDIEKEDVWNQGLKEVEDMLNETEKLAKKLGKIK